MEEVGNEFVGVPKNMKGLVIGRGRLMLNEIMQKSGASVFTSSRDEEGFTIVGYERQRACARRLIMEIVVRCKKKLNIFLLLLLLLLPFPLQPTSPSFLSTSFPPASPSHSFTQSSPSSCPTPSLTSLFPSSPLPPPPPPSLYHPSLSPSPFDIRGWPAGIFICRL